MSQHRRARLSVLLAAFAVAAATLVPVLPAAADDQPPAPEVTAAAEPTAEPTADPTEAPAASAGTATLTGSFVELSSDGQTSDLPTGVRLFHATDIGYLLIADAPAGGAELTLTVAVPAGIDADDAQALVDYSVQQHPLSLVSSSVAKHVEAMVNQTPNEAATHKIYAVLVTPSNMPNTGVAANQTAAKVATSVAHADDFWSQQSGGTIHFSLAGTTSWYYGSATCVGNAGSTTLWNQAAAIATTQLGYVDAPNNHLVLFFPSNTTCGGAIGLGSVERTTNIGGQAWVVGTDAAIEQATLAHELGHNLSLGHANWLECTSATPAPGFYGDNGCTVNNYGDLTDVMGFGQPGIYGGALSAPSAIRSGIWSSSAWKFAPKGTTTYALKPVSGNSGLRSVIVEDNLGVNYFVEFRNYTGEDAGNVAACSSGDWCVVTRPGVRILRLSQGTDYKGLPGDDSLLVGRTVGGVDRIDYLKNESFSTAGITIKVTALSSSGATVSVVRNFQKGVLDGVDIFPGLTYDSSGIPRVGDTYGLVLGSGFISDTQTYQWYRSGTKISGATKEFYKLANADYNKNVTVKITISSKGYTPTAGTFSLGAIDKAVMTGSGSVTAPNAAPVKAITAGFPWGTTFTYQWWRDAAKIAGATAATYAPVAADAGHQVKVVVTPTSAGNVLVPVQSSTEDYGLIPDGGVFGITGTQKVANVLSAPIVPYKSNDDGAITVTRAFQWYRGGVAITGANQATYTLVGADAGKTLTVKVTASAVGYISHSGTTAATGIIATGTIQGTLAGPNITKTGTTTTTIKLTVARQSMDVTETGTTLKYQWFRSVPAGSPEVAITGATASSYTLTTADYDKKVFVHITVTKPGYGTEVLDSAHQNYSVTALDTPVISGTVRVGEFVHSEFLTYGVVGPLNPPTYTWYRGTTVVQTGTDNYYQVKAADLAGKLTVKVTAANPGYLSLVKTSPATVAVVKGVFGGTLEANVLQNARVLTANPSGVAPAPTYLYQWLRNGAVITGATKVTYALTAADYGKSITVKVTATRSGFTSLPPVTTVTSAFSTYSVLTTGVPTIAGEVRVGAPLSVTLPTYSVFGTNSALSPTYQWYRAGVAIPAPLGTASSYTPVAGDIGKAITVKVTAGYVSGSIDLLPSVLTTAGTQKVGNASLAGWNAQFGVTFEHHGLVLNALPGSEGTGITEDGTTVAYQWFRNAVAITGATHAAYTLVAADTSKAIFVRVTTSKSGFTTIVKNSVSQNYTVVAGAAPVIEATSGGARVGETLTVGQPAYTAGGAAASVTFTYTWMRNGIAIAGIPATQDHYNLVAADVGKKITVKLVVSAGTEWLRLTLTTAPTATITAGP